MNCRATQGVLIVQNKKLYRRVVIKLEVGYCVLKFFEMKNISIGEKIPNRFLVREEARANTTWLAEGTLDKMGRA
jgi:hypothetical protein